MTINVIGVDPGPATGILSLHWADRCDLSWPPMIRAYQCAAGNAAELLEMLLMDGGINWTAGQIEHFVPSNLPRSQVTIRLENELAGVAEECGVHLTRHIMATVKPWASNKRLKESGISAAVPLKMVDALAAGRHAMFCAVRNAGIPDPLSKAVKA